MTDKEVKKLKRVELLEMLIEQTEENDKLKKQIADLEERLAQRQLKIEQAGSIAEAAISLSSIFAEAQSTADQYLESVRLQKEETEQRCRTAEEEARKRAEQIIAEAQLSIEEQRNQLRSEWRRRQQEVEQEYNEKLAQAVAKQQADREPEPKRRGWFGRK